MKKKGFTLVELLAVIAILAILVIIALPNVMGMFNTAKSKSFVTEAQAIYKQVATDFVTDNMEHSGQKTYCQIIEAPEGIDYYLGTEEGAPTCTNGPLDMTTTRGYYVTVNAEGEIQKFVVWDSSFGFAANMGATADDPAKKATYISVDTIKPTDQFTKIEFNEPKLQ